MSPTTAPRELSLEVPGLTLAGLAWGPEAATQRVLMLHGWLDSAASFSGLGPLLAAAGVQAVALDLPGHGHSQHRPQGAPYHFVDWVVDSVAALDALGWDRCHLIGHSMGAGVASLIGGTLPQRIERLVLIEGLGPNSVAPAEAPERLAKALAQWSGRESKAKKVHPDLDTAAARLVTASRLMWTQAWQLCHPDETAPSPPAGVALSPQAARTLAERGTQRVRTEEGGGLTWTSDPRLRGTSPARLTEAHVKAFLSRIAAPTLVVRGNEGMPFPAHRVQERLSYLGDVARVLELPGNHHLHLEHPAAVAEPLLGFLSGELEPGRPAAELGPEAGITLLVLDVDGVLTDGSLDYGPEGEDRKRFDVRDGLALKLLRRAGIEVALLSGRKSGAVERRARELGLTHLMLGIDDKLPCLVEFLERLEKAPQETAYMGDDLADLACLRRVGLAVAPPQARPEVLAAAHLVTQAPGGRGAVRELAEHLLKRQGKWESLTS